MAKVQILNQKACEMLQAPENYLELYFFTNQQRLINKWFHYFKIYDRYFSCFKHKPVNILEIGLAEGGSIQMWKSYFGKQAKINGIDILTHCKNFEEENVEVFCGSQDDPNFLSNMIQKTGPFDIIIDDGSHYSAHQIASFEFLFTHLNKHGIYLVEDVHSSYLKNFEGDYKKPDTFIEYCKNIVDKMHASYNDSISEDYLYHNVEYIHFYDSIVVIGKNPKQSIINCNSGK